MDFKRNVALCKFFAVANLILYIITFSSVNLAITFLMLGYIFFASQIQERKK